MNTISLVAAFRHSLRFLGPLGVILLSGCTLAPLTAPDEAFSLGRGETRFEIHAAPVPALPFLSVQLTELILVFQ